LYVPAVGLLDQLMVVGDVQLQHAVALAERVAELFVKAYRERQRECA